MGSHENSRDWGATRCPPLLERKGPLLVHAPLHTHTFAPHKLPHTRAATRLSTCTPVCSHMARSEGLAAGMGFCESYK